VRQKGYTRQTTTTARIIAGRFMMRIQHWILSPLNEAAELPSEFQADICPHLHTYGTTSFPRQLDHLIACKRLHYRDTGRCDNCSGMHKCKRCCTEFQIDSKVMHGGKTLALVFSVWKDMGDGRTPFSAIWEHHNIVWPGPREKSPCFEKGSLRSKFEEFRFDEHLSERDEKELFVQEGEVLFYGGRCGH